MMLLVVVNQKTNTEEEKNKKRLFFKNSIPMSKVEISVGSGHEEPSAGLCDSPPD